MQNKEQQIIMKQILCKLIVSLALQTFKYYDQTFRRHHLKINHQSLIKLLSNTIDIL